MRTPVNLDESRPSSRWEQLGPVIVLSTLVLLAVSTRALPLAISPLPYNNDGITESRIASDILMTGTLDYPEDSYYTDTHSVITPAYNLVLAFSSACLGSPPFGISQLVVAAISALTISGMYLVCQRLSKKVKGALAGAMVLSLSGTFIFLTASTWKASLGVALLVLLVYAHMSRSDKRMLALEVVLLFSLMIVHHLVALLAYLAIAYSTGISVAVSARTKRIHKGNKMDLILVSCIPACAFLYYEFTDLDRLSSVVSGEGSLLMAGVFLCLLAGGILVARQRQHSRFTFAPIPAIVIMAIFVWEYYDPFFPYVGGFPISVLVLGIVTSALVGVAWYGIESVIATKSGYRFIPIIWLLPVMTLLMYAVAGGTTLSSFQIIYRSFDFGYVPVALGISCAVAAVSHKTLKELVAVVMVLALVLITFPFGYMTYTLEGIRHDTQQYEVDALVWVDSYEGDNPVVMSDERISYIGLALYDFVKRPHLTDYLTELGPRDRFTLSIYLEEWAVTGVNHYPYGHVIVDQETVLVILETSNLLYVGGPTSNNIVMFKHSELGYAEIALFQ